MDHWTKSHCGWWLDYSIVAALGITLIIGAIAVWLVDNLWFNRLLVPATFVVAEVGMLGWLARALTGLR